MFVRVNAIFNTWSVILHEGRIGGLSGYDERSINKGQLIFDDMSHNVVYLFSIYDEMTHNAVHLFSTPNLGNYQADMTISPLAFNQSKLLKYFQ